MYSDKNAPWSTPRTHHISVVVYYLLYSFRWYMEIEFCFLFIFFIFSAVLSHCSLWWFYWHLDGLEQKWHGLWISNYIHRTKLITYPCLDWMTVWLNHYCYQYCIDVKAWMSNYIPYLETLGCNYLFTPEPSFKGAPAGHTFNTKMPSFQDCNFHNTDKTVL